nr:MAG TPA: hypothetical protein [Caudoviricetes sp.]
MTAFRWCGIQVIRSVKCLPLTDMRDINGRVTNWGMRLRTHT